LISVAQTDSGKINLLNALAAEYSLISIDSSVAIAKRTIAIAEKIDYPRGVIEAYHSVSNGFIRRYQKLLEEDTDIINSQRNIVLVFIVLCISLFFLLYNRFQLRQHTNYQIEINRHRNEIFTTSVTIQDKERKRIAEDLHDSLSSMLSTVKLNLERMDEEGLVLTESQLGKYHLALEVLNDSITEVRNISHNLMPASLSKLGLIPALKNLFDNLISHSDLKISFNTHDFEERFNEAAEISIYRIILELVTNTVKHAQASELNVQIIKYPAYINIIVEDNGKGFNWKKAKTGQGIGLTNIESRIELLKGKLEIDSGSGGTTVVIEIPIDEIKTNG
jgi:signal transduction histidine kinase